MATLKSSTRQVTLLSQLEVASQFMDRLQGLLGREGLEASQGLWIKDCNSIHTFFMKFPIDCVFLDSKMKVTSLKQNVTPFHLVWPQWGAKSVIEMQAGAIERMKIETGEVLDVGT